MVSAADGATVDVPAAAATMIESPTVAPTESVGEDEAPPVIAATTKEETTEELTADVMSKAEDTAVARARGNADAEPAEAAEEEPAIAAAEEQVPVAGE